MVEQAGKTRRLVREKVIERKRNFFSFFFLSSFFQLFHKAGERKSYREEPQTPEDNKSKGQQLRTDKYKQKQVRVKCEEKSKRVENFHVHLLSARPKIR